MACKTSWCSCDELKEQGGKEGKVIQRSHNASGIGNHVLLKLSHVHWSHVKQWVIVHVRNLFEDVNSLQQPRKLTWTAAGVF